MISLILYYTLALAPEPVDIPLQDPHISACPVDPWGAQPTTDPKEDK